MRLIDADALGDKVADLYSEGEEATEGDKVVNDVIDLIDNAPTVEYQGEECVNIKMSEEDKQKLLSALRNARVTGVVEPERPQGEWLIIDDTEQFIAKCSVCGRIEDSRMVKDYPFCHCGADMRVKDELKEAEND